MCRIKRRHLLLFSLLLLCLPLMAQQPLLKFDHISLDEGLSQAAVNAIVQDHRGFMWFGTFDGLNRFDGYEMTVYRNDPFDSTSLSHNKIMALCVDSAGHLWIGTDGGGLNRYNRHDRTFTRYLHSAGKPQTISSNHIRAIYMDSQSRLWIGTLANGIDQMDPVQSTLQHFPAPPPAGDNPLNGAIVRIYEPPHSRGIFLWLGTYGNGLARLETASGDYRYFRHDPKKEASLSHNIVLSLYSSSDSALWIGTYGGGVNLLDPNTGIFKRFRHHPRKPSSLSNDRVTAIFPNPGKGEILWVATEDGLNRFDPATAAFSSYYHDRGNPASLSSSRIRSICRDQSGSWWFGTMGGGINKYSPGKLKFAHYRQETGNPQSLNDNFVRSIYEGADGAVWVGTGSGGLNRLDLQTRTVSHYQHRASAANGLSHNSVRAVYQDRLGICWLGTEGGGLDALDPQDASFKHFRHDPRDDNSISHDNVWVIRDDPSAGENLLWIGTYGGGLNQLLLLPADADRNKRGRQVQKFIRYQHDPGDPSSLGSNHVLAICPGRAGKLWVGTAAGVSMLDRQSGKFRHYQHDPADPASLSSNTVVVIFQDSAGFLWIGTFGGGLNRFDPVRESFRHFSEKDGLPSNVINGILEDDHQNLWISTYNGLVKFDRQEKRFRIFDTSDGLQSKEFGYGAWHRGASGRMYFGGINGFNVFFPDSIKNNPFSPPVAITDFRIFDQSVPISTAGSGASPIAENPETSGKIVLSHEQNVFSFQFAALDYTAPQKNRYQYRLDGVDRDWVYSENRRSASYAHVPPGDYLFQVRGSNNDGVWSPLETKVLIVITPPFWETWWFRLLLTALVLGLLYLLHRYRVARALEMEQLRVRIASDLHDDLGSTLTRISLHSEIIQSTADAQKISRSSKKIGDMSREIVTSLSDIVWSIDARNDTVGDLLDRMRQFAQSILTPQEIKLSFQTRGLDPEAMVLVDIRQNIYLIFKEAINNIARHSDATEVAVDISRTADCFILQIADNGKGLADVGDDHGNGLRNMQLRSKRIGGELTLQTHKGLTVVLKLPRLG